MLQAAIMLVLQKLFQNNKTSLEQAPTERLIPQNLNKGLLKIKIRVEGFLDEVEGVV